MWVRCGLTLDVMWPLTQCYEAEVFGNNIQVFFLTIIIVGILILSSAVR
jgi:hypothetical protein